MIRINLLPTKAAKKKSAPAAGQAFLFILLIALGVEAGGLYFWYDGIQTEAITTSTAAAKLDQKVQQLQKVKAEIAEDERVRGLLEEQNRILEGLKAAKVGPPNMLLFLTYVLTNHEDSLANADERKALEKAGWNLQWDPDTVWLDKITEDWDGEIRLQGQAASHEDAAEFYERLESSIYFTDVEPDEQSKEFDKGIEAKYIQFKGTAQLNYRLPKPKTEDAEDEEAAATPEATPKSTKPAAAGPKPSPAAH